MEDIKLKASEFSKIFWFEAMKLPVEEQVRYHIHGISHYDGIDENKLKHALQVTVNTNYSLRSNFKENNGILEQIIHEHIESNLTIYNANTKDENNKIIEVHVNKPFDLSKDVLFRFILIKNSYNKTCTLLLLFHHIIYDGAHIFQDIEENYKMSKSLNLTDKNEIRMLKGYIKWEEEKIHGADLALEIEKLKNFPFTINLPFRNKKIEKFKSFYKMGKLDLDLFNKLKNLEIITGVSSFYILRTCWAILISKYSGQNELVLSYPVSTRGKYRNIKGSFVNTQLYPFKAEGKFIDILTYDKSSFIQKNRYLPFFDLFAKIKEMTFSPDVSIAQTHLRLDGPQLNESVRYSVTPNLGGAKLIMEYEEHDDSLQYIFHTIEGLFDIQFLDRLDTHFKNILNKVIENPEIQISDINILSDAEYIEIIYDRNRTEAPYPKEKTIHQLFEEQVEKTPDNIAVIFENKELTYKELNYKANQLAHTIRNEYKDHWSDEVKADTLIGIYIDRSLEMIIGILGILKSGAAYVPFDTVDPEERLKFKVNDCGCKMVLTSSLRIEDLVCLTESDTLPLAIDSYWDEIEKASETNLAFFNKSTDLAYVIYTSGTTGLPKGVMIEHKNLNNFIHDIVNRFQINTKFKVLCLTNIAFDLFGLEYLSAILSGGTCLLVSREERTDLKILRKMLNSVKIGIIQATPSEWSILVNLINFKDKLTLLVGGEALNYNIAEQLISKSSYVWNMYGPAETTIWSSCYCLDGNKTMSIGKPISNTFIYVLDSNLHPVSVGITGELYIGGDGLARGYFNRPDLTDERFIENPFASEEDKIRKRNLRIYKTGDLVRWLPDGNLEFIGRNDDQVKIRGFRVELGEIESKLSDHPDISQSVVLCKERETGKYLCAYYTQLDNISNNNLSYDELHSYLSDILPDYMVPSYFVNIDDFPLNISGKIDKKALPDPELRGDEDNYVAPVTELEIKLCKIWQDILEIERVGINDDFFRMGGNSILAIKLVNKISNKTDLKVNVSELFRYPTINQLKTKSKNLFFNVIPETNTINIPLSFAQERLWFIEQYEGGSNAYNIPIYLKFSDNMDIDLLKRSLKNIFKRHDIFRTVFVKDKQTDDYYQNIIPDLPVINEIHIDNEKLFARVRRDINTIFDLSSSHPVKVWIYHTKDENYMLINIHHIAFDGWSMDIFLRELESYYRHYSDNKPLDLPESNIQYKDFAIWQRSYLTGDVFDEHINYWKEKLLGFETLNFPTDKSRPSDIDYSGDDLYFTIDKHISYKLAEFAKLKNTTLYNILLSTFYILLYKYTGQKDIILGTPIANRNHNQLENVIGFFVNSLALRLEIETSDTFENLSDKVITLMNEAQQHQEIPFEKLVAALDIYRDQSRHPIFQLMFGVQSFGSNYDNELFSPVDIHEQYKIAKFDLSLFIDDSEDSLHCSINYAVNLFDKDTIERIASHYVNVLKIIADSPKIAISDINLLSEVEYTKIIYDWNRTEAPYPKEKTIHQLFEEQVEKTPDNIAVIFENKELTYKELNYKANQLAHTIRNEYKDHWSDEVKADTLIGIYIDRSLEMIIGILGILKSGAAYVPFDTADPEERLKFKINDCGCKMVLTSSLCIKDLVFLADGDTLPLAIDSYWDEIEKASETNPVFFDKSTNLAYVIYTSGSTGKPKGVMIEHYGVINLTNFHNINFKFDKGNIGILQFSSISFDASVETLFCCLLFGNTLYLCNDNIRKDADLLHRYFLNNDINFIAIPPKLLDTFEINKRSEYKALSNIIVGGEACDKKTMDLWSKYSNFFNIYGPTEATVSSTLYQYRAGGLNTSIGKPIFNKSIYILDFNMQPVPIGIPGELYIGGDGLARGYFNRPDLTDERFIKNPFASEEEKGRGRNLRIYKTGDLVRWLPDGNLEFIGRNDDQVKIRGFRIELGEVESKLSDHPDISQSVVLCKEREIGKYLCAYYTQSDNISYNKLSYDELHSYLSDILPDYMVPSYFVNIDKFPLNTSGKINKKALPDPELKVDDDNYVAPETKLEIKLCEIWQDILGIERVGINDDFFRMGGNSILAIKLVNRIFNKTNLKVNVSELFRHPTINQLKTNSKNLFFDVIPETDMITAPLSFAQERLWFIEQYEEGSNAYNMPIYLNLSDNMNIDLLKRSLKNIFKRHDIFRTVFVKDKQTDDYYQNIIPDLPVINEIYIDNENLFSRVGHDINTIFDLSSSHPVKIWIYHTKDESYILVNIHHIAFDGWSMDIFLRELALYYKHYLDNKPLDLPESNIQYKDFAIWQRNYLTGDIFDEHINYWKEKLSGFETLNFPTDKFRPSDINYSGDDFYFTIDKHISYKLTEFAKLKNTTLYNILLSTFYILLYKYSGQKDIILGTPIANRNHSQLENVIGFFVNSLALRLKIETSDTFENLSEKVITLMNEAQQYQEIPFEKLVAILDISKDQSRHPIFQLMFGVQSFGSNYDNELFSPVDIHEQYKIAKFDLSLFIDDSKDSLHCSINYAVNLFDKDTIERIASHYVNVLKIIADSPTIAISDINLLSEAEYTEIIYEWNRTEAPYPKEKTIHQLFEEQVDKTPDNTAVVFEDQELTYKELNYKANQLAHTIRNEYKDLWSGEVKADTLIGIYIDRSLEMIIGMLGILKSGAAYVPFDTADPEERLKFKINDCGCKMVLTSSSCIEDLVFLADGDTLPLAIDSYWDEIEKSPEINLDLFNKSTDLAYVIYTSGTTGKPKGVMLEHKGVSNLAKNQFKKLDITESSNVLQIASISFDASVWEIFSALFYGSKLVIASEDVRKNLDDLLKLLVEYNISITTLSPALLSNFPKMDLPDLKTIIVAGDICKNKVMNYWSKNRRFINAYGPTESTVCASLYYFQCNEDLGTNIGKSLDNISMYVLDNNLNPVPLGCSGELYIGGDGLARGYLKRPDLTNEHFLENPFASEEDKIKNRNLRIYKTGDLVRWLPDGNLEFIGRNDDQVKIRGFRIELGSIESNLSDHPDISQSVVLCKERETGKYLCAYYTQLDNILDNKLSYDKLYNYLSDMLPDYMVPSYFVNMDKFPLNTSGKIDKKALPDPELKVDEDNYVAPETELEIKLCEIWQEVLGIETIGIYDDFFRIGGNSILSIQLVSKMRSKGNNFSVKDIFECRTIFKLLQNYDPKGFEKINAEQGKLEGMFDLLPIQQWFFEKHLPVFNHFNQSFLIKVPELAINKLQEVFITLADHHDVLRSVFLNGTQKYSNEIEIPEFKIIDRTMLSEDELNEVLTRWQSGFDIEKGKIWQAGYIYGYSDKSARIFLAAHNLVIDAVSWRIFADNIKFLYEGGELGTKTSSYRQWVETVKAYPKKHKHEFSFWESVISEQFDYSQYISTEQHSNIVKLDHELTGFLLNKSNDAYHAEINDILLTSLAYALKEQFGNSVNHITLEGHGRENIAANIDVSGTVGWFTTAYPVKLEVFNDLESSIKNNKESLRFIPNKGIGYGAFKYSNVSEILNNHSLPLISFNYLGQFGSSENSFWQIISENSGVQCHPDNHDKNVLSINGAIMDGILSFSVTSSLSKTNTDSFTDSFQKYLTIIVKHCNEKKKPEYSFSDFDDYEPFVIINEKIEHPPLFFLPPGDGGIESYLGTIIPKMDNIKSCLFNNIFFHLKNKFGEDAINSYTFEKLASEYIVLIKNIQPKGPYSFLGWSFGGVLSFEIVKQLLKKEEKIANLFIVDSIFDYKNAMETILSDKKQIMSIFKDDINFKYSPMMEENDFNSVGNIALFKAEKLDKSDGYNGFDEVKFKYLEKASKYYVEKTQYNCLDTLLPVNNINLMHLNTSHGQIFNDPDSIYKIVEYITKNLKHL